jgi:hypothetical protein
LSSALANSAIIAALNVIHDAEAKNAVASQVILIIFALT